MLFLYMTISSVYSELRTRTQLLSRLARTAAIPLSGRQVCRNPFREFVSQWATITPNKEKSTTALSSEEPVRLDADLRTCQQRRRSPLSKNAFSILDFLSSRPGSTAAPTT